MRAGLALLRRAITSRHLERTLGGRRLLVALDPVDEAGAIPERLLTFERLLDTAPEWRGEVVFLQAFHPGTARGTRRVSAPLDERIEHLVTGINVRYGDEDWSPILHIRRPLAPEEIECLGSFADVQIISPARFRVAPDRELTAALAANEEIDRAAELLRASLGQALAARQAAPPPFPMPVAPPRTDVFVEDRFGIVRAARRPRRARPSPRDPLTAPQVVSTVHP